MEFTDSISESISESMQWQVSLGVIQEEVLSTNGQKQERNGRTLGHKISFWGAENVLGLNSGGDCTTL